MYRIYLKSGYFDVNSKGHIKYDSTRNYTRAPNSNWMILGIGKRHHSACLISLERAANGEDIGQGWVHDLDHGTHRMWAMPRSQRAVKVVRNG